MYLLNFSIVVYEAAICFFVCGVSGEGMNPGDLAIETSNGSSCGMNSSIWCRRRAINGRSWFSANEGGICRMLHV